MIINDDGLKKAAKKARETGSTDDIKKIVIDNLKLLRPENGIDKINLLVESISESGRTVNIQLENSNGLFTKVKKGVKK